MPEGEVVIVDAARLLAERIIGLWRRRQPPAGGLSDACVRNRLAAFVQSVCGTHPDIRIGAAPPAAGWLRKKLRGGVNDFAMPLPAVNDGRRIRIEKRNWGSALDLRRDYLPAVEQGLRVARRTALQLPEDRMIRDLFLLAEGTRIDRRLVRLLPGLLPIVVAERAACLAERPSPRLLRPRESAVELLYRRVLQTPPETLPFAIDGDGDAANSLRWARETAEAIAAGGKYHGVTPVSYWGGTEPPEPRHAAPLDDVHHDASASAERRTRPLRRRPRVRKPDERDRASEENNWMVPRDDVHEQAQDPAGLQRPVDGADVNVEDLADILSDMDEGRLVQTRDVAREALESGDPPAALHPRARPRQPADLVLRYPEWDWRRAAYRPAAARVFERSAPLGDLAWVRVLMKQSLQHLAYQYLKMQ